MPGPWKVGEVSDDAFTLLEYIDRSLAPLTIVVIAADLGWTLERAKLAQRELRARGYIKPVCAGTGTHVRKPPCS